MIEPQDFIRTVLIDIVKGTGEAQKELAPLGAWVNDKGTLSPKDHVALINFDVEVATTEGRAKGGKAGVFVGKTGAGGETGSSQESKGVGRIQFVIPLHLPNGNPKGEVINPWLHI